MSLTSIRVHHNESWHTGRTCPCQRTPRPLAASQKHSKPSPAKCLASDTFLLLLQSIYIIWSLFAGFLTSLACSELAGPLCLEFAMALQIQKWRDRDASGMLQRWCGLQKFVRIAFTCVCVCACTQLFFPALSFAGYYNHWMIYWHILHILVLGTYWNLSILNGKTHSQV